MRRAILRRLAGLLLWCSARCCDCLDCQVRRHEARRRWAAKVPAAVEGADLDQVVIRAAPGLPDGFVSDRLDGRVFDRSQTWTGLRLWWATMRLLPAAAVPDGREERDDGTVAQVWEVRP